MKLPDQRRLASLPGAALVLGLVLGLSSGQPVGAQQTCDSAAATTLPSSRFQDNGDGTVTDLESKLMWMRCAGGQRWLGNRCVGTAATFRSADAQRHADQLNRDGTAFFNDWRVPALRELATITERRCKNPRTNLGIFPGTPAAPFWSSTVRPGDGERLVALSFGAEGIQLVRPNDRLHVRLVRTGP